MTTTTAATATATLTPLDLAALAAATHDDALRSRLEIVRLLSAGFSVADVWRMTGTAHSTTRSLWSRFLKDGVDGLRDRRVKFTSSPDIEAALRAAMKSPPPDGSARWGVNLVRRWLQQRYDRRVSRDKAQKLYFKCRP